MFNSTYHFQILVLRDILKDMMQLLCKDDRCDSFSSYEYVAESSFEENFAVDKEDEITIQCELEMYYQEGLNRRFKSHRNPLRVKNKVEAAGDGNDCKTPREPNNLETSTTSTTLCAPSANQSHLFVPIVKCGSCERPSDPSIKMIPTPTDESTACPSRSTTDVRYRNHHRSSLSRMLASLDVETPSQFVSKEQDGRRHALETFSGGRGAQDDDTPFPLLHEDEGTNWR
jgi:hypothetical protein